MDIKKEAYEKAVEVLKKCSTSHGFNAAYPGYNAIWARDSMITSLGAILLPEFKNTIKLSLITLEKHQSKNGQIPNAIDKYSNRKPHVDFLSIDSTLWFIIGHYIYNKKYKSPVKKESIKKADDWLRKQDWQENMLLCQHPTTDWQDAFPHKYGHTINTQALWFKVMKLMNRHNEAEKLKFNVNINKDTKLLDKDFYLPWRWKNHNKYQEKGRWFDSLGNLLAIVFNLADTNKAKKIISYIERMKINRPFPVKAIFPPITIKSEYWKDYFNDCDARKPYHYSNAGIWTYIGCFYVLSLIKLKQFKKAHQELEKIAEISIRDGFSEWADGKTGKGSDGKNQAWNAGMYILAYNSLKNGKLLI